MTHPDLRHLSTAQQARLDKLSTEEPSARVIGWHDGGGPIVRYRDQVRWVSPLGRLVRIGAEAVA